MAAMKVILITVCAGLANTARVTQHSNVNAGKQVQGWLGWVSDAAENLNGAVQKVQNAAKHANAVVDQFENIQKKREQRGEEIGKQVVDLVEEVKQNDLMQNLGELAAAIQKDPEDAKQKANDLVTLMVEKNKLVQKGTELIGQYQEAAEADEQAKGELLQEIAQSAWMTKIKQKADEVKDIVSSPEAAQKAIKDITEELQGTEVGHQFKELVAQRKSDEEQVEQKTMELMDGVMKVEWVNKAKEIVNAISTIPQVAQEKADELKREIGNAQLVQKAGDVVVQLRKNEASHQKRVHELHQVLAKEWQGAVGGVWDKLQNPEERQKLAGQFIQRVLEENPNVAQKAVEIQIEGAKMQQALQEKAAELSMEVSQDDKVQKVRELITEIGNDPELARQKATELMQELSHQNELLRKATGLVHSLAENQRLEGEENNHLLENILTRVVRARAGSWPHFSQRAN